MGRNALSAELQVPEGHNPVAEHFDPLVVAHLIQSHASQGNCLLGGGRCDIENVSHRFCAKGVEWAPPSHDRLASSIARRLGLVGAAAASEDEEAIRLIVLESFVEGVAALAVGAQNVMSFFRACFAL